MEYFQTIYSSGLPHRAITVYMYLYDRADRDKSCWPAIPTMARELGMSRSTIKRALNDLASAGYLRKEYRYRENGSYTSNLYTLL
ncbi:helix-turn-helix domain-containing protein [Acetatifactor muris]|uniref:MarR family protein n=1 Tax=Acetatifactor muris TaxID=879566 RepID=A0A2K4ZIP3_9FIRM|nr:helix-turn-helix domain-containing protein [Acetatifactor muris]MCR2048613.1 helix-turn-helix domain-containing protein [Acetatifactor muris]SOY30330.1 MarR family protein [Acetatifactor muris]